MNRRRAPAVSGTVSGGDGVAPVVTRPPTAAQAGTWVVIGVPLCTAVWVYLALQLGLNRLGRGHLTLQVYHGDRTLGLQPVGRLAFTGFWLLFGAVGPLVLTGFSDLPTVVVGAVVLVVGVGLFFLSLRGLHQQMLAVRQHELDRALALYEEAYREVQRAPTLEVLQRGPACSVRPRHSRSGRNASSRGLSTRPRSPASSPSRPASPRSSPPG